MLWDFRDLKDLLRPDSKVIRDIPDPTDFKVQQVLSDLRDLPERTVLKV